MIASLMIAAVLAVLTIAGLALYLLPVMIALARHAPDLVAIAMINVAFGWTFAGWLVALALALRTPAPPPVLVQIVQGPSGPRWHHPAELAPPRSPEPPPLALPARPPGPEEQPPGPAPT